jgi:predicted Ser/Thr protein kinase
VLAHIQVERFYISRRYRVGAVTIGPQMSVDASERQITADRSIESLPASLSALTLFEPFGELVDASGGIVEFSDLFKRPLEAWKYLLLAIENGEVSLQMSNLPINAVMIASSNELHVSARRAPRARDLRRADRSADPQARCTSHDLRRCPLVGDDATPEAGRVAVYG